ncbi:MAG: outer membrane protein assembly factor BamB [Akkermansiaceae bacterium]|jgi:outer membrane protein assembly factor BamB
MNLGLALALLLPLTALSKETWPRFRGENGSGVSTAKIPTKLGKENLLWSAKLPGPGSSSPVIWEDKLFVTSEDREKKTVALFCLNAKSGKPAWTKELSVGDYHLHRFNNTAAASPAVSAEAVVVAWFDGKTEVAKISAFDHSGKDLWTYEVGPHKTQHGINLHPVIHGDHVVVCNLHMNDGYVGAISLKTGKELWKTPYPGDKTSYVTPYVRDTKSGHEVIVAAQAIGVVSLDLATGKEQWSLPGTMKQRTIVSPIDVLAGSGSKDCLIAVGCKNGVYFAVRPPLVKGGDAKIAWKMNGSTPYVPTPVSNGKTVFVLSDGGVLSALDAQSGKEKWKQQLQANFYASPIIVGGKLYALSREGDMIVADLSDGYKELSRTSLAPGPETQWADSTPAIAHDRIYVRLGARLDCFGAE